MCECYELQSKVEKLEKDVRMLRMKIMDMEIELRKMKLYTGARV